MTHTYICQHQQFTADAYVRPEICTIHICIDVCIYACTHMLCLRNLAEKPSEVGPPVPDAAEFAGVKPRVAGPGAGTESLFLDSLGFGANRVSRLSRAEVFGFRFFIASRVSGLSGRGARGFLGLGVQVLSEEGQSV